jgi:NADH:ubiquinone oxidoreductase subunit 2 (subunit N)
MQPIERDDLEAKIDARFRVMLILWFALLSSVVVYFLVSLVIQRPNGDDGENRTLTFVLTVAGTFTVIVSTALKQRFLARSVDQQRLELVQTGYIVALALCEFAALLGLVDRMVTGNRYYYVLFVIALIGMALHWPRRDHLLAASYKRHV